jgi:hypothetical protein
MYFSKQINDIPVPLLLICSNTIYPALIDQFKLLVYKCRNRTGTGTKLRLRYNRYQQKQPLNRKTKEQLNM